MSELRRLPVTDDPDTSGFFAAALEGRLCIRYCSSCGTYIHLPRAHCPRCHAEDSVWREVGRQGHLYSYCVSEQQIDPCFPVPYTVVLVELDEAPGVRLVGHLSGRQELSIGQPMEASFETVEPSVALLRWTPTASP
jgi:uncharacterized OB-fold protein